MATGFAKRQQTEWKFRKPETQDDWRLSGIGRLIPAHAPREQKIIRVARIVSSNHVLCFRNYRAFIPKFTTLNSGIYDIIQR
jgi:hypothetical protein